MKNFDGIYAGFAVHAFEFILKIHTAKHIIGELRLKI
jgi:hypothetical protein